MANPTTTVNRLDDSVEERQNKVLCDVQDALVEHAEAVKSVLTLIQEVHDSGMLDILHALLNSKEKVALILLEQVLKPSVLNTVRNAMAAVGMVSKINPDQLVGLVEALVSGLEQGQSKLESVKRVGVFDLVKALRDPKINRSLALSLGFLQGFGEKL